MPFLPDWAPNAHPLILHFPIALVFVAALLDAGGLLTGDKGSWRKSATWLYALGAVSAVATWYTGTLAADSVFLPTAANAVLTEHADLGLYTAWLVGGYGVIRTGLSFTTLAAKTAVRLGMFVLGVAGVVLITITATHGAELVYRYGVGVEAVETAPSETLITAEAGDNGIATSANGWLWEPGRAAAWKDAAVWVEGSAESLESSLVDGGENGDVLQFEVTEPTLFVLPGTIGRLQVDMRLDMSDFDGTLLVAHHVGQDGSYGFTSLAADQVRLGKSENSDLLILATEGSDLSGWRDVRVVADGTHFRSYVDTEMIVHGHGPAYSPGQVGLRLNGTGTVRLARMQAVDLAGVAGEEDSMPADSHDGMDHDMEAPTESQESQDAEAQADQ